MSKWIKAVQIIGVIIFSGLCSLCALRAGIGTVQADFGTVIEEQMKPVEPEAESIHKVKKELAVPSVVKISDMTDKGITVYWVTAEELDGYQVYRSYEEQEWELIYDIALAAGGDKSHYTYTDADFDADRREIFYKVCGYQNVDGEKVYSNYSEAAVAQYRDELKAKKTKIYMPPDTTRTLQVYYGWGYAQNVSWSSNNIEIAEVDENGTVYAHSAGRVKITCSDTGLDQTVTFKIEVGRKPEEPLSEIVSRYQMDENGIWYNESSNDTQDAVIMMAGDMMCMGPQQRAAYDDVQGYNFNDSFCFARSVLGQSDFAIGNLETMVAVPYPYTSEDAYWGGVTIACNAPNRYLDAVRYCGFDAVAMANNHNCDTELEGIKYTIEQVDEYELGHTGLYGSKDDERTLLIDVNGIKVGYLAYVSEHPGYNGKTKTWDLESVGTMLNFYGKDKAQKDIDMLRARGAEYIIVYMHWGIKNRFIVSDVQREEAQELADMGVDYIVGSHSHTVQPYADMTASNGKVVSCIFSLGDFNTSTNQIDGNRDSVVIRIRLIRNDKGEIELIENNYIAFYTYTTYRDMDYVTMPLDSALNGGLTDLEDWQANYSRIRQCVGTELKEYVVK